MEITILKLLPHLTVAKGLNDVAIFVNCKVDTQISYLVSMKMQQLIPHSMTIVYRIIDVLGDTFLSDSLFILE